MQARFYAVLKKITIYITRIFSTVEDILVHRNLILNYE